MSSVIIVVLWTIAVILATTTHRLKGKAAVNVSAQFAWRTALVMIPRMIFALFAASFLTQIVPRVWIGSTIGPESGVSGVLLASLLGGIMPGGPVSSFPIALFFWQSGAGAPQIVALLTGWSVFALHRVIAYELPIMGWRFTAARFASTFMIPPLAGLLAAGAIALFAGDSVGIPQ